MGTEQGLKLSFTNPFSNSSCTCCLNSSSYRLTPLENEEIKHQVQEMLEKGLVKESLSPCAVPIVLSPKKHGGWIMCNDCKVINKITIKYRFPLPRIDDLMDCLSGSK